MDKKKPKSAPYLTFMVIPEANGTKQLSLTKRQAIVVFSGIIISIIGLFSLIAHEVYLIHQINQLAHISLNNKILKEKFNEMKADVVRVETQLEHMYTFVTKLKSMTALEDPDRNSNLAFSDAASEFSQEDVTPIFPFFEKSTEYILPKLYEFETHLKQVWAQSRRETTQVQSLYEKVQDQMELLRSTPSVMPTHDYLSSRFGFRVDPFTGLKRMHPGIDVYNFKGTPIFAPADGVVEYVGEKPVYGKTLGLKHGYGIRTLYGHNSRILVKRGDRVKRGDLIARMGNTGRATSYHLHYEVRINDIPVDPENFILDQIGPSMSQK